MDFSDGGTGLVEGDASSRGVLSVTGLTGKGVLRIDGGILRTRWDTEFFFYTENIYTEKPASLSEIVIESGGTIFDTGTYNSGLASTISGPGTLTKQGSGRLILTGTNTYSGGTVLDEGTLQFGSDSPIGSGPLTINGGSLSSMGGSRTIANQVIVNGDFALGRLINLSGSITLNEDVTITSTNDRIFYVDDPNQPFSIPSTSTISGVIGGSHSLTFTEGTNPIGTIILTGENTYTGPTTIAAGRLQIGDGGSIGSVAGNIVNHGALLFNRSDDFTFGGAISGSGTLTKLGAGTLTLSASNSYTGTTTVSAGTLRLLSAGGLGGSSSCIVESGATLALAQQIGSSLPITIQSGGTLAVNAGGAGEYSSLNTLPSLATFNTGSWLGVDTSHAPGGAFTSGSTLSGSFGLLKLGSGTLTLTGENTYSGGTTIQTGTLALSGGGKLGAGELKLRPGATLDLGGTTQNLTDEARIAGNVTPGTLQTTKSVFIERGTFEGTLTGDGPDSLLWIGGDPNATVTLNGTNDRVNTDHHIQVIIGHYVSGDAGLIKLGNPYALAAGSETVQLHTGTLDFNGIQNVRAAKILLMAGIQSNLINSDTASTASFAGEIQTANGSEGSGLGGPGDLLLSGAISGRGFTKVGSGTLTLTGTNSYTNTVTLADGTLSLGSPDALGATGTIRFNGGTLQFTAANTTDYSGRFSTVINSKYRIDTNGQNVTFASNKIYLGKLTKLGSGTLTLAGTSTYVDGATVSAGKLIVNGTLGSSVTVESGATLGGSGIVGAGVVVENGGILSPGNSPGQITLEQDLTLDSGSTLLMEFSGTGAGMFDQLDVQGLFTAGGTLSLQLIGGYTPDEGDSFLIFNGATPGFDAGSFTLETNLGGGLSWDTSNLSQTGMLNVVPEPSAALIFSVGLLFLGLRRERRK